MARPESQALAGYFKTPPSQIPLIAGLLEPDTYEPDEEERREIAVLDPCAGDGEAVELLARALRAPSAAAYEVSEPDLAEHARAAYEKHLAEIAKLPVSSGFSFYTCELEASRHAALKDRKLEHRYDQPRQLRGDAFRVRFDGPGVGILWLNPPYDTDKQHGRLEEKFLARFTPALAPGGALVFLVPHYALSASAATIGRCYEGVSCYRFADGEYEQFKQVALLATRRDADLRDPDPALVARLVSWAADAGALPELPRPGSRRPRLRIPKVDRHREPALTAWAMQVVDSTAVLAEYRPWCETRRGGALTPVARVLPDLPVAEVMHRTYTVAAPPRPAHIAAGIAAGIFNGQRVLPDDELSGLPPLLVKGVFDREWRTVEEKQNKKGETTSVVQVQQPKLVVTVLDLAAHTYHTLAQGTERAPGVPDVADFKVADLLAHYGNALGAVMERQCPVVFDPRRDAGEPLADVARAPYGAQARAAQAMGKLRRVAGETPLLLGEIGCGKSLTALLDAKTAGAKRILIMAPPHLVTKSWPDEVAATLPEYECRVVESISDLEAIARLPADRPVVAVLSRETAKLGHGVEGVAGTCPGCGAEVPKGVDHAKKRGRCEARALVAVDGIAKLTRQLALYLRPVVGNTSPEVNDVLRGRLDRWRRRPECLTCGVDAGEHAERSPGCEFAAPALSVPADFVARLRAAVLASGDRAALARVFAAFPDDAALLAILRELPAEQDANDYQHQNEALPLLLTTPEARAEALEIVGGWWERKYEMISDLKDQDVIDEDPQRDGSPYRWGHVRVRDSRDRLEAALAKVDDEKLGEWSRPKVGGCAVARGDSGTTLDGAAFGSVDAAVKLLTTLGKLGTWRWAPECGEPLYQATPEPRRFPLARYIVRRLPGLFDFFVEDEAHEYQNSDSAQGRAAARIANLGMPSVVMTGSVMNGYARSMFAMMISHSAAFREEYGRDDEQSFCDRFGYRKRVLQDRDSESGEVVAFGSQTDRVERRERDAGDAPGVLPLFLFKHLLPQAVTLHKADLRIDLPACTQERVPVNVGAEVRVEYDRMVKALADQIKKDRFQEDLAGKLFGQLAELPSYLDRCVTDAGCDASAFEVRYPESVGGDLVCSGKLFPKSTLLPKEAAMIAAVKRELAEGRNVLVFGWHLGLLPRLSRLLEEHTGEKAPILYADKVPTGKRQAWIDREIVAKKRRIMVANPVAIQTGLNNLVWFQTEWWHENPACNPITDRQAVGRVDRIGQKKDTRIRRAYYASTLQEKMHDLLMAKVAISTATDGLDPESALIAAGLGDQSTLTGLSIGKQLWAGMQESREIPGVVPIASARRRAR